VAIDIKAKLQAGWGLYREYQKAEQDAARLWSRVTSGTSRLSGMPKARDPLEGQEMMARYAEYASRSEGIRAELDAFKQWVSRSSGYIPVELGSDCWTVYRLRNMDFKSWPDIGQECLVSYKTAIRRHEEAVKGLQKAIGQRSDNDVLAI